MEPDGPTRVPLLSAWDLLPLAGALALTVALPTLMRRLPDPIPTHFDPRGIANGWTSKASYPWLAFGLPGGVWGLVLLLGRAFVGSDQDPDGRKCAAMAPLRGLITTGLLWMTAGGLLIPRHGQGVILWMVGGLLALTFLGVGLMVWHLKRTFLEDGQRAFFRWGVFYVNHEDPRILVPKRLGLGWTLNFGNGLSWFIMALLLLPPALIVGIVLHR